MQKRHIWPDGHWNWPIKVSHKQGVVAGDMIWVSGQVDLTPAGDARAGDEIVVLGASGEDRITLAEVAAWWATSELAVALSFSRRIPG